MCSLQQLDAGAWWYIKYKFFVTIFREFETSNMKTDQISKLVVAGSSVLNFVFYAQEDTLEPTYYP